MKKELCITTYVSGKDYQELIPFFIFSILKSYPDYFPLVFCGEKLKANVAHCLGILENLGDFKIVENYLQEIPNNGLNVLKAKKWLLYLPEFMNYEYLYITDIDVFMVPEEPTLLEQHINHCETLGLDYSNIIRPLHNSKRITGSHFIRTKPYFEKMLPVIEKYKKKITEMDSMRNEEILFCMIEESGLGLPYTSCFAPMHGVHLGLFRPEFDLNLKLKAILFLKSWKAYHKKLLEMIEDPIFEKIKNNVESELIIGAFKRMDSFYAFQKIKPAYTLFSAFFRILYEFLLFGNRIKSRIYFRNQK